MFQDFFLKVLLILILRRLRSSFLYDLLSFETEFLTNLGNILSIFWIEYLRELFKLFLSDNLALGILDYQVNLEKQLFTRGICGQLVCLASSKLTDNIWLDPPVICLLFRVRIGILCAFKIHQVGVVR